MAKQRYLNTKFWSDPYVQGLDYQTKLFYLYLLTNEHTSICGIYEISKKTISFESGLKINDVERGIDTLSKGRKVFYLQNFIIICNFPKHQESEKSPKIKQGILAQLSQLPPLLLLEMDTLSIPYLYPLNYINTNTNLNSNTITPNGEKKPMYKEPTIQLDDLGEVITTPPLKESFGKYTAQVAKFYCMLVGKTSASRQLPAAKELFLLAQKEYPTDTIDQWFAEIKGRIEVAGKYYTIKKCPDWNLSKVAENWDKILTQWSNEIKKYYV